MDRSRTTKARQSVSWEQQGQDDQTALVRWEVVENMRSWPHSGFSVDQSVYLAAGDRAGIERLVGYMTRCPFSLSRLVKVSLTGQVIYKAEKGACRAFPDPQRDELAHGPQRNFQILDPLEFLAEFTRPGVPGAPFRPRVRT